MMKMDEYSSGTMLAMLDDEGQSNHNFKQQLETTETRLEPPSTWRPGDTASTKDDLIFFYITQTFNEKD
jgi:hypothetical protein